MKYKIVFATTPEGLEKEVQQLLDEGYEPFGGVQMSINDNTTRFAQSLTKAG